MSEVGPAQPRLAEGLSVEDLSHRYGAVLVRYFARRGIARPDAEDMAQEVFARMIHRQGDGRMEHADAYLFTTAANLILEVHRYNAVRTANPPQGFYESIQRSAEFSPARMLEGRQELDIIIKALQALPERARNVFMLARLENMPRAEIAVRLGVSKRTVEQDLTMATAYLGAQRRRLA